MAPDPGRAGGAGVDLLPACPARASLVLGTRDGPDPTGWVRDPPSWVEGELSDPYAEALDKNLAPLSRGPEVSSRPPGPAGTASGFAAVPSHACTRAEELMPFQASAPNKPRSLGGAERGPAGRGGSGAGSRARWQLPALAWFSSKHAAPSNPHDSTGPGAKINLPGAITCPGIACHQQPLEHSGGLASAPAASLDPGLIHRPGLNAGCK